MKITAADLALAATAVDRAWRSTKQPEWSAEERQALCSLALTLRLAAQAVEIPVEVKAG